MKDQSKTKQGLIQELASLKQKIAELEQSESEYKNLREVLRKSEEKYSQLSENAHDAILSMDLDGIIQYANRAACDLASPVNLIGLSMRDITPPNLLQNIPELLRKRREGDDSIFAFEWEVVAPDSGRHVIMDVRSSLLTENGKPSGVLIIARDVTDNKLREEMLRESEERYKRLVEGSPDITWSYSDKRGTIYASARVQDILGYSPDYLYRNPWLWNESIHSDDRGLVSQAITDFAAGRDLDVEYRIKNAAGDWLWFHDRSIGRWVEGSEVIIEGISIYITGRKQAEEVLRKSEEKYRAVIENMEEGYHEVDIKGNFTFFNESVRKIMGYEREELLGMNNRQYADEENTRKVYEVYNRIYRTGEPVKNFEWQIIRKDGARRDIEVSISLIRDMEGHPSGFRGIVRDTTDRKRAEEALHRSEENFRHSLDDSPMGVRIVTVEGETIYANRAILNIYGYDSMEDLKTTPVEKRYTPESHADFLIRREKRQQGVDVPSEYIISIIRKDGEIRYLQVSRRKLLWDGERQFQVLYNDITDHKRAEEALRESEEKYRSLVEYASEAVYVAQDNVLKFVNRAGVEIAGYSEQELTSRPFIEFIHPDDRTMVGERYLRRLKGEELEFRYPFRFITKNGDIKWLELGAALIDFEGRPATLNIVTDITERKRTELALRESEYRYRELFENIGSGVSVYETRNNGEDFIFKEYNAVAEMLDKNPRGQVIGRSVVDVFPGVKDFGLFDVFQRVYRTGKSERHPVTFYKDEKISGWRENYVYKLPSGEIVAVFEDITQRKRAEEALRESEELLNATQHLTKFGGWVWNVEQQTMFWTNEVYRIHDFVPGEMMPGSAEHITRSSECYDPENRPVILAAFQRCVEEGQPYDFDFPFTTAKGRRLWVRTTAQPVIESGRVIRVIGNIMDITERKQAEEELRTSGLQLRALATRLQQIREEERIMIAREIHDEMGGGLTGLKMDLSWLLHKIGDADTGEERVALMDKIHTSNALIDQMIRVVRRISTDLRPSVLDDLGLISALEWQLSEFTSRTEIPHEFTTTFKYVNMKEDTAVAVFRIFQEALTNVVRHARATKVIVVLREEERSLFGDETLVLEIRDNGRGITEKEILNPESLGLLGMKERVLAFGGALSVRGEPGGGTAMVLKIPR